MIASRRAVLASLAFLLLPGLPGCQTRLEQSSGPPPVPQTVTRLLGVMNERLSLMHEVARSKWNSKKPITDRVRERELLEAVSTRGDAIGLSREQARGLFTAQIEAAKVIQEADMAKWSAEKAGPFTQVSDLATIRARLDALNEQLLQAYAAATPTLATLSPTAIQNAARSTMTAEGVTEPVRTAAIAPLLQR